MKSFIREKKNSLLSVTTLTIANDALNREIPGIGTITNIEIDSVNKNVGFDLNLNGETDIIKLNIEGYKITLEEEQKFLCWNKIEVSKPWINLLIAKYAPKENKIAINSTTAWLVDLLV